MQMVKTLHEFRDPVHTFIKVDTEERKVIDSRPVQRLRHIHQLATSYLVYPGATHRRFEHSLGVMELAGRVYDRITSREDADDFVREAFPEIADENKLRYWRRVIRLAGLCHDIGHLPFSHAAEKELLPDGWSHERISRELIFNELSDTLSSMIPPVRPEHVAKLAVGPKHAHDLEFSLWETMLSEVIVGDAFGVDRMDYLLRDSHHAGVVYGRFDHNRLIDSLRILPSAESGEPGVGEPQLGVDIGGLFSAEALLLARYFMYSQVYFHRVRMVYDIHLIDFLRQWLEGGQFSTDLDRHLALTDNEVIAAIRKASLDGSSGSDPAKRLDERSHFRDFYSRDLDDASQFVAAAEAVFEAAQQEFGTESVRFAGKVDQGGQVEFPVVTEGGKVQSSLALSETLRKLPVIAIEYVYIVPEKEQEARRWLSERKSKIIEHALLGMEDEEE